MSACPVRTARHSVFSCIRRRKRSKAASTASIPITSSMRSRRRRSRLRTADEKGLRKAVRGDRHILGISVAPRKLSRNRVLGNWPTAREVRFVVKRYIGNVIVYRDEYCKGFVSF